MADPNRPSALLLTQRFVVSEMPVIFGRLTISDFTAQTLTLSMANFSYYRTNRSYMLCFLISIGLCLNESTSLLVIAFVIASITKFMCVAGARRRSIFNLARSVAYYGRNRRGANYFGTVRSFGGYSDEAPANRRVGPTILRSSGAPIFNLVTIGNYLADRRLLLHNMIIYWHQHVVRLSVCL